MAIILDLSQKPCLLQCAFYVEAETISPILESEQALRLPVANRLPGKLLCNNSEPRELERLEGSYQFLEACSAVCHKLKPPLG